MFKLGKRIGKLFSQGVDHSSRVCCTAKRMCVYAAKCLERHRRFHRWKHKTASIVLWM